MAVVATVFRYVVGGTFGDIVVVSATANPTSENCGGVDVGFIVCWSRGVLDVDVEWAYLRNTIGKLLKPTWENGGCAVGLLKGLLVVLERS